MANQPSRQTSIGPQGRSEWLCPALIIGILGLAGCAHHGMRAMVPVHSAPLPRAPAQLAEVIPPDIHRAGPPEAPPFFPGNGEAGLMPPIHHPRARAQGGAESSEDAPAARPPTPQISPELSPDSQAALERKTNENISGAEKNLRQAQGRILNATQTDLAEKIHAFLDQAREATRVPDWPRAQSLSQKAYLLSVELANSL